MSSRGTPGNDVVDTLFGFSHAFYGYGEGLDILWGGVFNDRFEMTVDPLGDMLIGGAGQDVVDYSNASAGLWIDLAQHAARYWSEDGLIVTSLTGIEDVVGTRHDDVLAGDRADNVLDGGDGFDLVSYRNATEGVYVDLAGGRVDSNFGSIGVDTLRNIEAVEGSRHNDVYWGSEGEDTFVFGSMIGRDGIHNFDAQGSVHDVIRIEGVFEDYHDLREHMEDTGPDVVIHIDDDNSITLTNVGFSDLGPSDFDLV
jgi:hypothetical protein